MRWVAAVAVLLAACGVAVGAQASDNPAPPWSAVQSAGSTGVDEAIAVDVLPSGAPVVVGNFSGTAYFPTSADDSVALVSAGSQSVFVALMDPAGEYFTWAIAAGGTGGYSTVADVAVTGGATPSTTDDRVIITGTFSSGTQMLFPSPIGDIPLTRYGTTDMYVALLEPEVGFTRVQRVGQPEPFVATGEATPTSIAVGPSDRVIVAGMFTGMVAFPKVSGSVTLSTADSSYQAFVAGMNLGVTRHFFSWAQQAGGPGALESIELAADPASGRLTLAGTVRTGVAYFPTGRPAPDDSIAVVGDDTLSLFVSRLTTDDTYFDWVQTAGDVGLSQPRALALTPDGDVLVGGRFGSSVALPRAGGGSIPLTAAGAQTDGYVASMGADDSAFTWATTLSATATDSVNSLAVAADGTPLAAGGFEGAFTVPTATGPISLTTALGEPDAFVAGMAPGSPYFTWVQVARGQSDSNGATPNGVVFTSAAQAMVAGKLKGTMAFPTSSGTVNLTRRGIFDAFTASISLPRAPVVPPAPLPADPPRAVSALAGDASATVTWSPPATTGSYPISHYLATSSPGGRTCLVAAPAMSCDVTGLSNGTSYTFTVKALTGAGWSAESSPSNAVVPRASAVPSIAITGSRDGRVIRVSGTTVGLGLRGTLKPWLKLPGQSVFSEGSATIAVSADGTFEWSRRTNKNVSVYVATSDGSVTSNTVRIPVPSRSDMPD